MISAKAKWATVFVVLVLGMGTVQFFLNSTPPDVASEQIHRECFMVETLEELPEGEQEVGTFITDTHDRGYVPIAIYLQLKEGNEYTFIQYESGKLEVEDGCR